MITGLKGLAADGHEINCRTCRSGKTCNVANAHGYWVGACVRYTPEKPMTNADRIRAMSDEELAELLAKQEYKKPTFDGWLPLCNHVMGSRICHENGCRKCWLDWLKQEVEGDA